MRSPAGLLRLSPLGTSPSTLCTQQVLKTMLANTVGSFPWELEGEEDRVFRHFRFEGNLSNYLGSKEGKLCAHC